MIMGADKRTKQDEIEMLLPWFVTDKLDDADRQRVEAYLDQNPDMRARLNLSVAERGETVFLNEPRPATSASTVEQFMAQIDPGLEQRSAAQAPRTSRANLWDHMKGTVEELFTARPGVAWASALAALIMLVQAAVIIGLLSSPQGHIYETASGSMQMVAPGTYVDVRFANQAPIARITEAMSELNMTIAGGPKANGFFMVRIGPEKMSASERKRLISALKARNDIVLFVTKAR